MQTCCSIGDEPGGGFEGASGLLKAAADPHRLAMLARLAAAPAEVCVCEFTDALPLNQPTVSHHLRVLREAGLVTCERRGTWVYYRLAADARARLHEALQCIFQEVRP